MVDHNLRSKGFDGTPLQNEKIVYHMDKTVRFRVCHLRLSIRNRLISGRISPYDILIDNINYDHKKNCDWRFLIEIGYKIVFTYFGKDHLLIFNE